MILPQRRRKGWASIAALLSLSALLTALALALNAGWLATARGELQNAADAAALAASGRLIDDEWLRQGTPNITALLTTVRDTSFEYAGRNRALGRVVVQTNDDVAIGAYDGSGVFVLAGAIPTLGQADFVNVAARRMRSRGQGIPILLGPLVLTPEVDVQSLAQARLDRDIIGFRALDAQPIPLVPLGIRSDPSAADTVSWEYLIINRNGGDTDALTPGSGFAAGTDLIPEMDVSLTLDPGTVGTDNGSLVQIGTGLPLAQVSAGVTATDLATTGGRLELNATNILPVSVGVGPVEGSADHSQLVADLNDLRVSEAVRIFPLIEGSARINAFVAARVVRVTQTPGGPLVIRLQPAMRSASLAITDATRRGVAHLVPSPYLARPRLSR